MLTYVIEENGKLLYEQIYDYIKSDIVNGLLRAGEKLPSKRAFAENNGVSVITVQYAYEQLIDEGYIYTLPRKGYFVADIVPLAREITIDKRESNIIIPQKKMKYRIDLSSNRTKPENFPFTVWAKLSRETISDRSKELMEISPTSGIYELRKAISDYLKSYRGMCVDPDQIVVGAGTEYLYGIIIQLLGMDKKYCIENPGYAKLTKIYKQFNIECDYANMDEQGVTVKELERTKAQVAHICPNHHFPTGITMPAIRRYEMLSWVNERSERYIVEDDYDSEFRTNGKPIPTLFSIDNSDKVIYMNTFSKSLSPTIRISYMVLPVPLANRFYKQLSFYSCTVSNFEQYTLAAFISKGYFEKHINRMRLYYSKVQKQLMDMFNKSRLKNKCNIIESESGLHFIIKAKTKLSESEIQIRLAEREINLRNISEYYMNPDDIKEHLYIFNYSNVDIVNIEEAFDLLYECF